MAGLSGEKTLAELPASKQKRSLAEFFGRNCSVRIRRSAGEHRTSPMTPAARPSDTMTSRCCEFLE